MIAVIDSNPAITKNRAVGFAAPPRSLQCRYTLASACFRWGVATTCSRYVYGGNGYDKSVTEVQPLELYVAVSEVKPPPEPGSGQKQFRWGF
jgi:hypothetical protein